MYRGCFNNRYIKLLKKKNNQLQKKYEEEIRIFRSENATLNEDLNYYKYIHEKHIENYSKENAWFRRRIIDLRNEIEDLKSDRRPVVDTTDHNDSDINGANKNYDSNLR